jgi:hypothetical protein
MSNNIWLKDTPYRLDVIENSYVSVSIDKGTIFWKIREPWFLTRKFSFIFSWEVFDGFRIISVLFTAFFYGAIPNKNSKRFDGEKLENQKTFWWLFALSSFIYLL